MSFRIVSNPKPTDNKPAATSSSSRMNLLLGDDNKLDLDMLTNLSQAPRQATQRTEPRPDQGFGIRPSALGEADLF